MLFKRFERNETGRDFVVGDIHGCFDVLTDGMTAIKFDPEKDRMFSVGDLVDRGPSSIDAINWIRQPWFHAIRGNHEQMCIESDPEMHLVNGGAWFLSLSDAKQLEVRSAFDSLPIAIEVQLDGGIAGIVHAEVPGDDWNAFRTMLQSPPAILDHIERFALWGRDVIRSRSPFAGVAGIDVVYVGHTILPDVTEVGNVRYIDTGAFLGRGLTIMCMGTGLALRVVGQDD
jgi:serine/threonine protein phosphatase 1